MDIWNIQIFFKYFTRGIPGKTKKLESESGNEGGSSYFGLSLNFQFTTELAP